MNFPSIEKSAEAQANQYYLLLHHRSSVVDFLFPSLDDLSSRSFDTFDDVIAIVNVVVIAIVVVIVLSDSFVIRWKKNGIAVNSLK